eukprot:Seg2479.7 transcript_id=Seg2479.7/GoldUCD/mRNA.D3Y31 product="hypothetical protein" protein_id=Seg2479.7/GoldUCD/D3Y31
MVRLLEEFEDCVESGRCCRCSSHDCQKISYNRSRLLPTASRLFLNACNTNTDASRKGDVVDFLHMIARKDHATVHNCFQQLLDYHSMLSTQVNNKQPKLCSKLH